MAIITSVKVGSTTYGLTIPLLTIESVAASTPTKGVPTNMSTYTGVTLDTGTQVKVKFTNGNSASSPTINISGTVKNIVGYGMNKPANYNIANSIMSLVYDGTNWVIQ